MSAFDADKPKVELPLDVAAWIELYRKLQGEAKAIGSPPYQGFIKDGLPHCRIVRAT